MHGGLLKLVMSISLYVHIPFCLKRCIYCDFVSGIYSPEKEWAYIEALKKEIKNISNENYPSPIPFPQGEGVRGRVVTSLYIGGGTPTAISSNALSDLIHHIFTHFSFNQKLISQDNENNPLIPPLLKGGQGGVSDGNYEATIEANPGTLDKEKLQILRSSGINRLSIGVQSFDDDELNFLGRLHSSYDAGQAVHLAQENGFENIGIDLIYGIPGQNFESWKKTLEKAVSLKPQHISTYELTVEKGTLLYEYMNQDSRDGCPTMGDGFITSRTGVPPVKKDKKGEAKASTTQGPLDQDRCDFSRPLDEGQIIEMYDYAINYLTAEGFVHYEISNFALPEYFCRHNMNYWNRGEYYGAGLGAHSFIKGKRFYNTAVLDDYINLISANKSPVKETEDITENKAISEAIFLALRRTIGISLKTFNQTYGKDILTVYHKEIKELQEAGLLELEGNIIRLTRKGLLLSNEIFVRFM